jgi:colanic acid biosynthesis glycosyl transferase WcaI
MLNNPKALRVVDWVCNWMYERAAHIVVPAPGIRDRLLARGVAGEKISVIYNWCAESSIDSLPSKVSEPHPVDGAEKPSETFDVLFAGTMGKAQALDAVLNAGLILKSENSTVRLLLMGGGIEVERLKKVVEERSLTNVKLLPRVPMSEVGAILARADALIVHLKDDPLFRITTPSKTQAYLAAGKPVVMAVAGDAAQLVRESEAGVCAQPEEARSIADAIKQLSELGPEKLLEMGQRGRRYYYENLSLDVGARKFVAVFNEVAPP